MFSEKPSRMYAALRCIEVELERQNPRIKRIKEIMKEAGRELKPIKAQQQDSAVKKVNRRCDHCGNFDPDGKMYLMCQDCR